MSGARRSALLCAVTLLAALPVTTGCPPPPKKPTCGWLAESPEPGAGRLAVLVDVSTSTRSASGLGSPDYPTALRGRLEQAVGAQRTVAISPFSGPSGNLSLTTRVTNWKEQATNPKNLEGKRDDAADCLTDDVRQARQTTPGPGGTDVLRAITQAAAWLRADPKAPTRELVVATDGLVTHGCADLARSTSRGEQEIDAIVTECLKGELGGNDLDGITVTMVGVGHPSADQPMPSTAQARWLSDLWAALCGAAGATGTPEAVAVPDTDTAGTVPAPNESVQDPPVRLGTDAVAFSLSAALFDTGGWTLRPEAAPLLTAIAVQIRSRPYTRVVVQGYADPRGGDVDNQTLSENRARAVADALAADGVRSPQPRGMGATRTCFNGTPVPATETSDAGLQCLRRVDITAS
ncbi:OmpA family protein [Micromonospora sp. NPDC093244]|uniref:OmpA family protein n=1 Tax=Micromonospora sp. NPDC093244 TaxID=3155071 RepID=UPI0034149E26